MFAAADQAESIYIYIYIYIYTTNPSAKVTQIYFQVESNWYLHWIFSFYTGFHTKLKEPSVAH